MTYDKTTDRLIQKFLSANSVPQKYAPQYLPQWVSTQRALLLQIKNTCDQSTQNFIEANTGYTDILNLCTCNSAQYAHTTIREQENNPRESLHHIRNSFLAHNNPDSYTTLTAAIQTCAHFNDLLQRTLQEHYKIRDINAHLNFHYDYKNRRSYDQVGEHLQEAILRTLVTSKSTQSEFQKALKPQKTKVDPSSKPTYQIINIFAPNDSEQTKKESNLENMYLEAIFHKTQSILDNAAICEHINQSNIDHDGIKHILQTLSPEQSYWVLSNTNLEKNETILEKLEFIEKAMTQPIPDNIIRLPFGQDRG